MKLARESVQRVATLARLRLTDKEETELTDQLEQVLSYMDKLSEIDTANQLPFAHTFDMSDMMANLREDKVENKSNTDALLANAPERDETFFRVPKILE